MCPGVQYTAVIYSFCILTFGGSCTLKACAGNTCTTFFPEGGQISGQGPGFFRNTLAFQGDPTGTTTFTVGTDAMEANCIATVVWLDDITVNLGDGAGA